MDAVIQYIADYFRAVDKFLLALTAVFVAVLIFLNYRFGIETKLIPAFPQRWQRFLGFYAVYAIAFIVSYLFLILRDHSLVKISPLFICLLLISPAIFAAKSTAGGWNNLFFENSSPVWKRYGNIVINLPIRLVIIVIPLWLIRFLGKYEGSFWGFTTAGFNPKPYAIMLLIMVPLIAFASTQSDFLHVYPKLRQVAFMDGQVRHPWLERAIFEISYGIDFITIELFFRGFLVIAFMRFAGPYAVLPMAAFYCSIHFGKPLLECVSSFFGGLLLGVITYRTRSILGGLMVHLGIAWMMEGGGWIGGLVRKR